MTFSSSSSSSHLIDQSRPSTHSLYPTCQIKASPSTFSLNIVSSPVPLAVEEQDINLSVASLTIADKLEVEEEVDTEQIMVLNDDNDESYELIRLKEKDEDYSEGSDSGYSGPSPDGTIRDTKSPESEISCGE